MSGGADDAGLPLPLVIGAAVGGAVVLLLCLIVFVVFAKRRGRKSPGSSPAKEGVGRSNSYRVSGRLALRGTGRSKEGQISSTSFSCGRVRVRIPAESNQ